MADALQINRLHDVRRFYSILLRLSEASGGLRSLADLPSRSIVPSRGVYIFLDPAEPRSDSGSGPRVVRVGTHALTAHSKSTLRQRLAQHRGLASGGGNHRGSIFRLLIGQALIARSDVSGCASWGRKNNLAAAAALMGVAKDALASSEKPIEDATTRYLRGLRFLWIAAEDDAGRDSLRGYFERNAIALLSNCHRPALDPATHNWLGHWSDRPMVRDSGLWNQQHVTETHDPEFLNVLESAIEASGSNRQARPL